MKISYGIACILRGSKKLVVIRKKHSYAFAEFVTRIRYDKIGPLRRSLNFMSIEEKILIEKLDFRALAMEVGFYDPKKHITEQSSKFHQRETDFHNILLRDGGKALVSWIHESSSNYKEIYEIPKGKKNYGETYIDAAIREFEEETNIGRKEYNILPIRPHIVRFSDKGQDYEYVYFIALSSIKDTGISFKNKSQISEISSLRTLTLDELRIYEVDVYNIYKQILKRLKNKHVNLKLTT